MTGEDRDLGMTRAISRRDFVNGMAVAAGAAVAGAGVAQAPAADGFVAAADLANYPPARTGLRGDYAGVYGAAHALRDGMPAPSPVDTGERYDLVVVGAGLSGLAAAWFYRERAGPKARILILDNHDDFGGHAKRNEFVAGGRMLLAPGGSNRLPSVDTWSHESRRLLEAVGVAAGDPSDRHYPEAFRSRGMGSATFFEKAHFGRDRLIHGGTLDHPSEALLRNAPLPAKIKSDLWRLTSDPRIDYLPGLSTEEKIAMLRRTSYRDYLLQVVKVDPGVIDHLGGVWCLPVDAVTAWNAYFRYKPGFAGLGIERPPTSPESKPREATNYYLPGGNHSVCRLILRDLIPDALPHGSFVEVETQRTNYASLDRSGQPTRVRLGATVVSARHVGTPPRLYDPDAREVEIAYVAADGSARSVRAGDVVMAGNNNMIAYIVPDLPDAQKAALHQCVRAVNVQTNVLLRDWKAFENLKVSSISFPKGFYSSISLETPRQFGRLQPSLVPDQPILANFNIPHGLASRSWHEAMVGTLPPPGTPIRDQMRQARAGLYATSFDRFERAIRGQAAAALGAGGFDPARDILAITLNRWGHGYALPTNELFDDPSQPPPYVVGRQRFGRIAIANSDAAGIDTINAAFDQAARAIQDLEQNVSGRFGMI